MMRIRPAVPADLDELISLTIDVFRPFYEESFRSMVPPDVFVHQHGDWAGDYHRLVPTLHDPEQGKQVAVAHVDDRLGGYVAWAVDADRRHGEIVVLAVRPEDRRTGTGRALCEHALAHMRASAVDVVGIGTGGDDFHAPARRLYESLGFSRIPITGYLRSV